MYIVVCIHNTVLYNVVSCERSDCKIESGVCVCGCFSRCTVLLVIYYSTQSINKLTYREHIFQIKTAIKHYYDVINIV